MPAKKLWIEIPAEAARPITLWLLVTYQVMSAVKEAIHEEDYEELAIIATLLEPLRRTLGTPEFERLAREACTWSPDGKPPSFHADTFREVMEVSSGVPP